MISNKDKYRKLCKTEDIPLFSQYFWMDVVCGADSWDVILVEENNNILGSLVYYLNSFEGEYEIRKAPLTQNNGIIYYYPKNIKYDRKLSFEYKVADIIIDRLEELNIKRFRQYFHHGFTNWLPFYWRNYKQTTRYTYIIEVTSSLESIFSNFNGNVRNQIRKAEKIVNVQKGMNPRDFYDLNEKIYIRQGIGIPYNFALFNKLYNNLNENDCVEIIYAIDESNNIHSAALFAYDSTSVYYLMSGSDDEFRDSQSLTLLIYEGIKLANRLGKSFDFEGSMKKNIEHFFRQFGAEQKQYFDIQKEYK